MKVILTGTTGFIGREVLDQCIQNPAITKVIALSRSTPKNDAIHNPKVKLVLVHDFKKYSEEVLYETKDADACIWALGKAWVPNNEVAKEIHVDYTLAAAKAFSAQASDRSQKLRFVLLSGGAAEQDQSKALWFMQDYRRIRGQAESELLRFAESRPDSLGAHVLKPGFVLGKEGSIRDSIRSLAPSVKVDDLASALVQVAVSGWKTAVLENQVIRQVVPAK